CGWTSTGTPPRSVATGNVIMTKKVDEIFTTTQQQRSPHTRFHLDSLQLQMLLCQSWLNGQSTLMK
ncbi:unnamed protein product, partial [Heterosigma akashiwo]